jgi:hypothetical protein
VARLLGLIGAVPMFITTPHLIHILLVFAIIALIIWVIFRFFYGRPVAVV